MYSFTYSIELTYFISIEDFSKAMSQAGPSQFQEVIRQELEYSMKVELDKILATAPSNELEVRSLLGAGDRSKFCTGGQITEQCSSYL